VGNNYWCYLIARSTFSTICRKLGIPPSFRKNGITVVSERGAKDVHWFYNCVFSFFVFNRKSSRIAPVFTYESVKDRLALGIYNGTETVLYYFEAFFWNFDPFLRFKKIENFTLMLEKVNILIDFDQFLAKYRNLKCSTTYLNLSIRSDWSRSESLFS